MAPPEASSPHLSLPSHRHTVVCVRFFSAQSRHLSRPPSTPPTAVSLLSVSISLLLVCVFVYFVHQIPRVREIVGHLSFSDWLAVISGPIRAVAKGGLAFLVLADQYSLA